MGSSLSSGRVRCMAFWRDDLLGSCDGEDNDDGRAAKSLTQARDNLLQLVVAAILFSSIVVYLMSSSLVLFSSLLLLIYYNIDASMTYQIWILDNLQ